MAEYIEREAVCSDCKNQKVCVDKSVCPVGRAPAADVEVVKHGRWENNKDDYPECNQCGYMPQYDPAIDDIFYSPYCPNCGAKMMEVSNG